MALGTQRPPLRPPHCRGHFPSSLGAGRCVCAQWQPASRGAAVQGTPGGGAMGAWDRPSRWCQPQRPGPPGPPRPPPVAPPCPSWPGCPPRPLAPGVEKRSRGRCGQSHGSPTAEPSPHARGLSLPKQERLRQPHPPGSAPGFSPGGGSRDEARPRVQPQWARTAQRRQGHTLQRRILEHKLLTAVSPWVGDVDLLCARPRPAMRPRRGTAQGAGGRGRGPGTCPGAARGRRGRGWGDLQAHLPAWEGGGAGPVHAVSTCRGCFRLPLCLAQHVAAGSGRVPRFTLAFPVHRRPRAGHTLRGAESRARAPVPGRRQPVRRDLGPFLVDCSGRWRAVSRRLCSRVRVPAADGIRRQLQGAHLASTPVFALLIQVRSPQTQLSSLVLYFLVEF